MHDEKYLLKSPNLANPLAVKIYCRDLEPSVNIRKFFRFCLIILAVAVAIGIASPQLLEDQSSQLVLAQLERRIDPATKSRAWGETGATVLPLASQIMAMRNQGGMVLSDAQKGYLRPLFGDLVDRVTIFYNANLLDRWSQGGKETHIGEIDSAAQTYCDRIYIRAANKAHDTDRMVLLAHELTHSQQCLALGGIGKFGFRYFQGYYQGGQTYQNNPLEKSALAMELKFARRLCKTVSCPPTSGRYYPNYRGWGLKLPAKLG